MTSFKSITSLLGLGSVLLFANQCNAITVATVYNITNNGSALVTDVNFSVLGNGNASTALTWLIDQVDTSGTVGYNKSFSKPLGAPNAPLTVPLSNQAFTLFSSDTGLPSFVSLVAGTFVTLHYGGGAGGGGASAWYVTASGDYTFPSKGPQGAFGDGGLSQIYVWSSNGNGNRVPDGGTTVLLLGGSLAAMAVARRFIKR